MGQTAASRIPDLPEKPLALAAQDRENRREAVRRRTDAKARCYHRNGSSNPVGGRFGMERQCADFTGRGDHRVCDQKFHAYRESRTGRVPRLGPSLPSRQSLALRAAWMLVPLVLA
jgi:hypothetical protein